MLLPNEQPWTTAQSMVVDGMRVAARGPAPVFVVPLHDTDGAYTFGKSRINGGPGADKIELATVLYVAEAASRG